VNFLKPLTCHPLFIAHVEHVTFRVLLKLFLAFN
jgi:hypothetical protein